MEEYVEGFVGGVGWMGSDVSNDEWPRFDGTYLVILCVVHGNMGVLYIVLLEQESDDNKFSRVVMILTHTIHKIKHNDYGNPNTEV